MTAWITANPWASVLLVAMALIALRWALQEAWAAVVPDHCDHSECERPYTGDVVVEIFESKRQSAGDGVESGV